MADGTHADSHTVGRTAETRRPRVPGRRKLAGAVAMVTIGSFMPWVDTAVGTVSGARGAGLWTFYAAMLGLAATLVPFRAAAIAQGAVLSLVALALPVWQVVHMLDLVGTGGWFPGPGLVLVFAGGVLAGVGTQQMFSHDWPSR